MSVLIGMLNDLDHRGQAPQIGPGLSAAMEGTIALGAPDRLPVRRTVLIIAGLLVIGALAAALLYQGHALATPGSTPAASASAAAPVRADLPPGPAPAAIAAPEPAVATAALPMESIPASTVSRQGASSATPPASSALAAGPSPVGLPADLPSYLPPEAPISAAPAPAPRGVASVPPPAPMPGSAAKHKAMVQAAFTSSAALSVAPVAPSSTPATPATPATAAAAAPSSAPSLMASTALASTQAQAATPTPIGAPAVSGDPAVAPTTSSGLIRRSGSANDEAADLARAYELSNRGRSAEAIEMLQHALRVWPQHHESRNALATLLSEGGQPGAALSVLLEGAALEPGRFALNAARLQAEAQQPENALQTLAKVPDAQRDALYHALVAAIAQRAGRSDQAITEFQAALQAGPPRALWYVGLGATLERLERRADALAAYRQALALGGASPAAAEFAGQRVAALATQTLGTGAAPTAATATRASEAR